MFRTKIDFVEVTKEGLLTIVDTMDNVSLPYYLTNFKDGIISINQTPYSIVSGSVNHDMNTQYLKVVKVVEQPKIEQEQEEEFNNFYEACNSTHMDRWLNANKNTHKVADSENKLNKKIAKQISKASCKMADDFNMGCIEDNDDPYFYFEKRLKKFVEKLIVKGIIN